MAWNEKQGQFIARYRVFPPPPFGSTDPLWATKRLPKAFKRHQSLDAERWLIGWYAQHHRNAGVPGPNVEVQAADKTIALLADRWLAYRERDDGTALNTFVGYRRTLKNWILTNDRFPHYRIDHLDMEQDFNSEVCLAWIDSLCGRATTQLRYAEVLKQFFRDCIAHGWVSADMFNPLDRPIVARRLSHLRSTSDDERTTSFLTAAQVATLLTTPTSKVIDYRRVKYVLTVATGLREGEVQGLMWSDLHLDGPTPYVFVERQLIRGGPKPLVHIRELRRQGIAKTDFMNVKTAIASDPKRKSKRPLPLLPIVVAALRFWWRLGWTQHAGRSPEVDDPVFSSGQRNAHQPYGQFCTSDSAELVRADLDRVGLPTEFVDAQTKASAHFSFHSLRHTFATLLEAGGVERSRIGELLGHKAASVAAKHYIGTLVESRASLVAQLPLPNRIQLRGTLIKVAGDEDSGNVIDLEKRRARRP